MPRRKLVLVPGEPIAYRHDEGRVVHVGADTGRALADRQAVDVYEMTFHPGGEAPLHFHRFEDEWFYVVDGEVTFWVGDRKVEGTTGTFAYAPQEVPHAYAVRSETARVLIGSNSANFTKMFEAMASLGDAAEPERWGELLEQYGIVVVGPNPGLAG